MTNRIETDEERRIREAAWRIAKIWNAMNRGGRAAAAVSVVYWPECEASFAHCVTAELRYGNAPDIELVVSDPGDTPIATPLAALASLEAKLSRVAQQRAATARKALLEAESVVRMCGESAR